MMTLHVIALATLCLAARTALAFNRGEVIARNPNLYCQRGARERHPIHAVCDGVCVPRNGSHLFSLSVNKDTYQDGPVIVELSSLNQTQILGFALIAYEVDERGAAIVKGQFEPSPDQLAFECPQDMRGMTVVHHEADPSRYNASFRWNTRINEGTVRFRAWVVVRQSEIFILESKELRFSDKKVNVTAIERVFDDIMKLVVRGGQNRPSLAEFTSSFLDRLNSGFELSTPFSNADSTSWMLSQFFPNGRSADSSLPGGDESPFPFSRSPRPSLSSNIPPWAQFNPMLAAGGGLGTNANPFLSGAQSPAGFGSQFGGQGSSFGGFPGAQGVPGSQGFPGVQGGAQGFPGSQGFPGAQGGAQGFPGSQGFPGAQGFPGSQGFPGAQGFPQGFPQGQNFGMQQQGAFGGMQGGAFGAQGGAFGAQGGAFGAQGGAFGAQGGAFGAQGGTFGAQAGGFGAQAGGFRAQGGAFGGAQAGNPLGLQGGVPFGAGGQQGGFPFPGAGQGQGGMTFGGAFGGAGGQGGLPFAGGAGAQGGLPFGGAAFGGGMPMAGGQGAPGLGGMGGLPGQTGMGGGMSMGPGGLLGASPPMAGSPPGGGSSSVFSLLG